ncbi:22582_t:CDS:2, partial [Gigaspora margarita]
MELIIKFQKLFEITEEEIKLMLQDSTSMISLKDKNIASWLGIDLPETVYIVKKAIESYDWINYKKSCNKQVQPEEEIFIMGVENEPETKGCTAISKRKEVLLDVECGIHDYGTNNLLAKKVNHNYDNVLGAESTLSNTMNCNNSVVLAQTNNTQYHSTDTAYESKLMQKQVAMEKSTLQTYETSEQTVPQLLQIESSSKKSLKTFILWNIPAVTKASIEDKENCEVTTTSNILGAHQKIQSETCVLRAYSNKKNTMYKRNEMDMYKNNKRKEKNSIRPLEQHEKLQIINLIM